MDDELAEVVRLELLLLEPRLRNDPEALLVRLHADFREHGASGQVWDRSSVARTTVGTREPIHASEVGARRLGPDAVLVTYVSDAQGRRARRSSTWVRERGRWLMLFHQGTLVEPG